MTMQRDAGVTLVLRKLTGPYLVIPSILLGVTLISIPGMIIAHTVTPLLIWPVGLVGFGPLFLFMFRYRIWLAGDTIFQRAAGGTITSIRIGDIDRVRQERSNIATFISLSRPSRRLTIYARTSNGVTNIDVSLLHFKYADIRGLMRIIQERRPDLEIPKEWT